MSDEQANVVSSNEQVSNTSTTTSMDASNASASNADTTTGTVAVPEVQVPSTAATTVSASATEVTTSSSTDTATDSTTIVDTNSESSSTVDSTASNNDNSNTGSSGVDQSPVQNTTTVDATVSADVKSVETEVVKVENKVEAEAEATPKLEKIVQEAVDSPVGKEVAAVTDKVISKFRELIDHLIIHGNSSQKEVIRTMDEYIAAMAPNKAMDADTGAKWQRRLWTMVSNVLTRIPRDEFDITWNTILNYFNEHGADNDVLGARFVFRFNHMWAHSKTDLDNLNKLLNLIRLTCNPATRAIGLKQVDLDRTLANVGQESRNRLLNFYKR